MNNPKRIKIYLNYKTPELSIPPVGKLIKPELQSKPDLQDLLWK